MAYSTASSSGIGLMAELRAKWGWFVGLGVLLLILGLIAFGNIFATTIVSVFFIGGLMIIGGIGYILHAFQVKTWGGFFLWLLSGLLYGAAGILAFYNPLVAAAVLTLTFAFALVIAGALRIGAGFRLRPGDGWGWIVASGVVTLLVGVLLTFGWPLNTLWLLGLVLALDLTFQGVAALALGLNLRSERTPL